MNSPRSTSRLPSLCSPVVSSTPGNPMQVSFVLNRESDNSFPWNQTTVPSPSHFTPLPTLEPRRSYDQHNAKDTQANYKMFGSPAACSSPSPFQAPSLSKSYCEKENHVPEQFGSSSSSPASYSSTPPKILQRRGDSSSGDYHTPTLTERSELKTMPHPYSYHEFRTAHVRTPPLLPRAIVQSPQEPQLPEDCYAQQHCHTPGTPKSQSMDDTGNDASLPKSKARHSNAPYTLEMVDFLHYCRETLKCPKTLKNLQWKAILELFRLQFPLRIDPTEQGIQGRYYRDQIHVLVDTKAGFYRMYRKRAPQNVSLASRLRSGTHSDLEGGKWEDKKVRIRDREIEGIKALELKYELVDLGVHSTFSSDMGEEEEESLNDKMSGASYGEIAIQADESQTDDDNPSTTEAQDIMSGAERLLSYQWSVIRDVDRERAKKILGRRARPTKLKHKRKSESPSPAAVHDSLSAHSPNRSPRHKSRKTGPMDLDIEVDDGVKIEATPFLCASVQPT